MENVVSLADFLQGLRRELRSGWKNISHRDVPNIGGRVELELTVAFHSNADGSPALVVVNPESVADPSLTVTRLKLVLELESDRDDYGSPVKVAAGPDFPTDRRG